MSKCLIATVTRRIACPLAALWVGVAHAAVVLTPAQYLSSVTLSLDGPNGAYSAFSNYITAPGAESGAAVSPAGYGLVDGQAVGYAYTTPVATSVPVTLPNTPAPAPLVYAAVDVTSSKNLQAILHDYTGAAGRAEVHYQMSISGPTPTVDVLATWFLQATVSANAPGDDSFGAAGATFNVIQGSTTVISDGVGLYNFAGPGVVTSQKSGVFALSTGIVYDVSLFANATSRILGSTGAPFPDGGGHESNRAVADPTFQIAANVPNAGAYRFSFSDGIGNGTSPVPEPATWELMVGGMVAIRLLRYRYGRIGARRVPRVESSARLRLA